MKRAWNYVITMWQPVGLTIAALIVIFMLYFFRLGSLMPALSAAEVSTRNSSNSLSKIIDNPINAPYKIARLASSKINNDVEFERVVGSIVASISVIFFYNLIRRLINRNVAILGSTLYLSSSAMLNNGRLATTNVMLLSIFIAFCCGYALRFNKHIKLTWIIATVLVSLSLYTPGVIFFIATGLAWYLKDIKSGKMLPKKNLRWICLAIGLILVAPLIAGLAYNLDSWKEYFGIPSFLPSIGSIVINLLAVPFGIIANAPISPEYRLGNLATLDIFASVMFIIGVFSLVKQYKLDRVIIIGGVFAISTLFTAISGNYENSFILVPFIYVVISAGMNYLLITWKNTFPFNPLARTLSLIILSIAVLISCNFQVRRYMVAWANNSTVKAAFVSK